jgi:hypothetical protein
MFETLDAVVWPEREWGTPAPELLRALASADARVANDALYGYRCFYFHQDQHSPDTALTVPFLVEIANVAGPVQVAITELLAQLLPWPTGDVTPGSPTTLQPGMAPFSQAVIDAVAAARGDLERLLDGDSSALRCAAAWVLSRLPPASHETLRARLRIEGEMPVRVSLILALSAVGAEVADETSEGLTADVVRVLKARSPLDDTDAAAFARLLACPPMEGLLFENGVLATVAVRALGALGVDEPRTSPLLWAAAEAQTSRIKDNPTPMDWHEWARVSQTNEEYAACRAAHADEAPLRVIGELACWAAYGSGTNFDAQQRRVLERFWRFMPNPPRKTHEAMRAYLSGRAVSDCVVEVHGRRGTLATHLSHAQNEAQVTAILEEAALTPDQLFVLIMEQTSGGFFSSVLSTAWPRFCANSVIEPRALPYVAALTRGPLLDEASVLLKPWLERQLVPPSELDPWVSSLCNWKALEPSWLLTFPAERRVDVIAGVKNPVALKRLAPLCDARALADAVLAKFLSPTCEWTGLDAQNALAVVETSLLQALTPPLGGTRQSAVDAMLRSRGELSVFELELSQVGREVKLTLWGSDEAPLLVFQLPSVAPGAALEALRQPLRVGARRRVTLTGDVDDTVEYQVMLKLGELAAPIEVVDRKGTVLRSG